MAFQRCPICNGTGKTINKTITSIFSRCETCNGTGIIDEFTGLPPAEKVKSDSSNIQKIKKSNIEK